MRGETLKVGELATRTGLSVRTLHYYEEIGLLPASVRNRAGHRLYGAAAVVRLQQIILLRQLGFTLSEIQGLLRRRDFSPGRVLELHTGRLKERIAHARRLLKHLEGLAGRLRSAKTVSVEEFIQTIKEAHMLDKYYTAEQKQTLAQRKQALGEDRIRRAEAEWKKLFEQFRAHLKRGADPASEPVQALAKKGLSLVQEFTGGDAGILKSLGKMYKTEGGPQVLAQHGYQLDPQVWDYMSKAMAAAKGSRN